MIILMNSQLDINDRMSDQNRSHSGKLIYRHKFNGSNFEVQLNKINLSLYLYPMKNLNIFHYY